MIALLSADSRRLPPDTFFTPSLRGLSLRAAPAIFGSGFHCASRQLTLSAAYAALRFFQRRLNITPLTAIIFADYAFHADDYLFQIRYVRIFL